MRSLIIIAIFQFSAAAAIGLEPSESLTAKESAAFGEALALPGITAESFRDVVVQRDIVYAKYGGESMMLDLYLPRKTAGPIPCIIAIRGGGFRAQPKEFVFEALEGFAPISAHLAANGFASACISYRGTPDHLFLDTVHDAKAAVRFLRAKGSRYNIDGSRIGAVGTSAGGHLSVMLAVTGGMAEFEGDGGNPEVSSDIQAAVSWAGVFDFISRLRDGGQQDVETLQTKRQTNGAWIGEPFSETGERWKAASPFYHVGTGDAPALLVHCKGDAVVPYAQSVEMHQAMHKLDSRNQLLLIEGGSHGIWRTRGINEKMWTATLDFFRSTLRFPNQNP